jgi:selenocysteine lyase/cysteine desulfurase
VVAEDQPLSFKQLFSRSLSAAPGRLHMAAHSHHLWPDASFDGQQQAWLDAAALADRKWDKVMDEVWPQAQANVASELGVPPDRIVFASNTHDFLIRLSGAAPRRADGPLRILTSDGEFHSARRQLARWEEEGEARVTRVPAEPFDSFSDRFLQAARDRDQDMILVSQVLFASGRMFKGIAELSALADPGGPWVVVDGYHAFLAVYRPLPAEARDRGFYLGGGYKYAMAGEGMAFLHCPPGFGPRPTLTGWFAEFGDLTAPPGSSVGYTADAMRFMGATFDPSALYRFNAVQQMLREEGLTTAAISAHVAGLQQCLLDGLSRSALAAAELLNPLGGGPHARFLAFRSPRAAEWNRWLMQRNCVTDVRGDVLRIGLGLYHDKADVDAFADLALGLD